MGKQRLNRRIGTFEGLEDVLALSRAPHHGREREDEIADRAVGVAGDDRLTCGGYGGAVAVDGQRSTDRDVSWSRMGGESQTGVLQVLKSTSIVTPVWAVTVDGEPEVSIDYRGETLRRVGEHEVRRRWNPPGSPAATSCASCPGP